MKQDKKKIIILGVSTAVAALAAVVMVFTALPKTKVIAPTCTEKGYTIYTQNGKTQMRDIVDAKGHSFSEWHIQQEPNGMSGGQRSRTCTVCGFEEAEDYYQISALPQIFLDGDIAGIGKKEQVPVTADFSVADIEFDGYALLKYQGHSSLQYPKKNYTVKFFSDEKCNEKMKFQFSHWKKENKYILKADYIDASRSRNLISADIWSKIVSSRQLIHSRLNDTSNKGAIDGFPVELYLNKAFQGVYNMVLHKDNDLFGMKDGKKDGIVIINETKTQAAYFKDYIDWETTPDWEIEYSGTEEIRWLTDKTDAFVEFVRNSTDEVFKEELKQYADVESLVDYLIAVYVLGLPDNSTKDLLLVTYDDGVFIASLFDMEAAFGLKRDGSGFYDANYGLPVTVEGKLESGTDNFLWDRLIHNFYNEICSRYKKLRSGILSEQNIKTIAEDKINAIPAKITEEEFKLYPQQPQQNVLQLEQITTFTKQRLLLLDELFVDDFKED